MVQLEKVDERNSFKGKYKLIKLAQNFRKPKQVKNHLRNCKGRQSYIPTLLYPESTWVNGFKGK